MHSLATNSIMHHRGAVLFVALVFLVLITLLGLTAASVSVLQERMTGGLRNSQLALMGGESAARGVESLLWNKSNNTVSNKLVCGYTGGNDNCYQAGTISTTYPSMNEEVTNFQRSTSWITTGATTYPSKMTGLTGSQAGASLANQPVYLIEDLGIVLAPGAPPNGNGGDRYDADPNTPGNQTLHSYRITARSTGGNSGSTRVVQSVFLALPPSM